MGLIRYLKSLFASEDCWLYIMIIVAWAYPLFGLVNALFLRMPIVNTVGPYMQNTILVCSILLAVKSIKRLIHISDVLFYISFCFLYLLQYIIYPQNEIYLDNDAYTALFTVAPYFFLGLFFDTKNIKKLIFIFSCAMILFRTYHDVFYVKDFIGHLGGGGESSAMWQAYTTLPYVMCVWWYMFKKISVPAILFSIIGFVLLTTYGNRGSLFCLGTFVTLYLLFFIQYRHRWLVYTLILISAFIFFIFSMEIIIGLSIFVDNLGMSTRIFDKFFGDSLINVDTRNDLINQLQPYLNNMPFGGYGINGVFRLIGIYPHKLHYDLWASYGYFIGTAIMLLLIRLFIKAYRCVKSDSDRKQMLLMITILGLEPLLFSFSYLIWPYFFMYIGYCVGRIRHIELKPFD